MSKQIPVAMYDAVLSSQFQISAGMGFPVIKVQVIWDRISDSLTVVLLTTVDVDLWTSDNYTVGCQLKRKSAFRNSINLPRITYFVVDFLEIPFIAIHIAVVLQFSFIDRVISARLHGFMVIQSTLIRKSNILEEINGCPKTYSGTN